MQRKKSPGNVQLLTVLLFFSGRAIEGTLNFPEDDSQSRAASCGTKKLEIGHFVQQLHRRSNYGGQENSSEGELNFARAFFRRKFVTWECAEFPTVFVLKIYDHNRDVAVFRGYRWTTQWQARVRRALILTTTMIYSRESEDQGPTIQIHQCGTLWTDHRLSCGHVWPFNMSIGRDRGVLLPSRTYTVSLQ